jgi:spore germination cell wall hydrolase CwlJ-like protein
MPKKLKYLFIILFIGYFLAIAAEPGAHTEKRDQPIKITKEMKESESHEKTEATPTPKKPKKTSIPKKTKKPKKNTKEKTRKRKNKTKKAPAEADVYLLAKLIFCEVGTIQDDECLKLCGSVVLNRLHDKRYPDTLEGVIFQRGQYEVTWNGAFDTKTPDARCMRISRELLKNGSINKKVMGMSERWWGTPYKQFKNVKFSIF